MEYTALYRKYRPKNFDEVIGQNHIINTLKNQISNNQISHAYLFTGTRGTGKTSIAKIFSKAINCENKSNKPCNTCNICNSINLGSNLDILEIDAASNNGVEYVRELRENVKYPPLNAKYKVYIIDEVHMLSDSAFNALLKTLEEPPKYVVFILATTEVHKLPATILSRCIRFDFKLVSQEELEKHLMNIFKQDNIKCDKESISLIASLALGSVRDMLSIADMCSAYTNKNITYEKVLECTGSTNKLSLNELVEKMLTNDPTNVISIIDKIAKSGKNIAKLNRDIVEYMLDLTTIKTCSDYKEILNYPQTVLGTMEKLANKSNSTTILTILQKLTGLENDFRFSSNPLALFESTILSVFVDNASLIKRVQDLEEKLKDKK